jgi:hypothetical protein
MKWTKDIHNGCRLHYSVEKSSSDCTKQTTEKGKPIVANCVLIFYVRTMTTKSVIIKQAHYHVAMHRRMHKKTDLLLVYYPMNYGQPFSSSLLSAFLWWLFRFLVYCSNLFVDTGLCLGRILHSSCPQFHPGPTK